VLFSEHALEVVDLLVALAVCEYVDPALDLAAPARLRSGCG
jgi:hypothetical protein